LAYTLGEPVDRKHRGQFKGVRRSANLPMVLIEESDTCNACTSVPTSFVRLGLEQFVYLLPYGRNLFCPAAVCRHKLRIHRICDQGLTSLTLEHQLIASAHLHPVRNNCRLNFVNGSLA